MTPRAFLAAILGGIAMFIWSFIAHDLLPLGETGMHEFKDEAAMLELLKQTLATLVAFIIFRDTKRARMQPGRRRTRR